MDGFQKRSKCRIGIGHLTNTARYARLSRAEDEAQPIKCFRAVSLKSVLEHFSARVDYSARESTLYDSTTARPRGRP